MPKNNKAVKIASNLEANCLELAKQGTKDERLRRIVLHLADEGHYLQQICGDGTKPHARDQITLKQPEADPAVLDHLQDVMEG